MGGVVCLATLLVLLTRAQAIEYGGYSYARSDEDGRLAGDVQNWAILIQNYILQVTSDGLQTQWTQKFYDLANYTIDIKNGSKTIEKVQGILGDYFTKKEEAAKRIVKEIASLHSKFHANNTYEHLSEVKSDEYKDADIPKLLPKPLVFNPYFKQNVSMTKSTVKISDEVPRDDNNTIQTILMFQGLNKVFTENSKKDPLLRWQYFGSSEGMVWTFPGREWDTNFAGFYNDYDPRVRPWYIAATSGPKDVVIIMDCSYSMNGKKFEITKQVVSAVLSTLTKQDYVNVICARASHWDEVGKWHYYNTEVLSCKDDRLVPASTAHRKDLNEKTGNLIPGGTSELKKGFEKAFELLNGPSRTGCQTLIVLITDGLDTDGESVRCGPGYYTRSGYVPGPICRYNWTKVFDFVSVMNKDMSPRTRIFSYLTKADGEEFPGKLACDNGGHMQKLEDGTNLISQMSDYFDFLVTNSVTQEGLWTAPYLDAWGLGLMVTYAIPVVSTSSKKLLGVVGIDATLDEIENLIVSEKWGSVYAFLINKEGETIFHPLLKPSSKLSDDPIFITISKLEQRDGKPENFSIVENNMKAGKSGFTYIKNAVRGVPKGDFSDGVKVFIMPATYYYTSLNQSEYSFAFSLADTDSTFRRSNEPQDKSSLPMSVFNILTEYNSPLAKERLNKNGSDLYKEMEIKYDEPKYKGLTVTYKHSSVKFAPKCYCNPNKFIFDDDLAMKTVMAHEFMNGDDNPGCPNGTFEKNIKADVLITSQIEAIWKKRNFDLLKDVKWTYIGCRSGVFRTYPGHRSSRPYDPTKRPWYHRVIVSPHKTSISTAYMDAAGAGKIISISQAIFEGMQTRNKSECEGNEGGLIIGGCVCTHDSDCASSRCYVSDAPSYTDRSRPRCAMERVEAVTSLDILYNDFHNAVYERMEATDNKHSCDQEYLCPDGEPGCQTRCYLFDKNANIVIDYDFLKATALDERKYKRVSLGKKEGEVMHELIYKHQFFVRKEQIDFQGSCSVSPYAPKVSLEGIPMTPGELDNYYKNKGPTPSFSNSFGCIQDVVGYQANDSVIETNGIITGNVSGPCKSGFYYVSSLPKTNLYLLVIENWRNTKERHNYFNFNCKITNSIAGTGAFRIVNGTCAHNDEKRSLAQQDKCPRINDIDIPCFYNGADTIKKTLFLLLFLASISWYL
ncbi:voltage-dependent calcium channel subunit alpha-2/delta-1-like [Anneissia japonica]|uniref:voltage-dependent calcium channel subunit alpha-2/delta-1-like n=2 Tax=Anneissia japonica TaxID=1529436 RepID=UPI001425A17F|nr:voltage-dependent calcium channel subunit alpha-2/delta-1-like [Anneissia japonica]XP_033124938.1 voltage-dependent calcium channel subunit alpha-2/delta-1-like [Anneissia japonica]XP_033124939.1 voltage-dependent calcium channel subunit alpha-2/delta-1-like [Anneissia japonica]